MAHRKLLLAFGLLAAASPLSAGDRSPPGTPAPAAGPNARFCMKVEPMTGSRLETVRCWTREEWAFQGVDVDKDWAKEGVAVIE